MLASLPFTQQIALIGVFIGGLALLLNFVIVPTIKYFFYRSKLCSTFALKYDNGLSKSSKTIQMNIPGSGQLSLMVCVKDKLGINRVNFRFVHTKSGDVVSNGIITIARIDDDGRRPDLGSFQTENRRGGRDFNYRSPRSTGINEDLVFTIGFTVKQPWNGYLYFESFDREGNYRHSCLSLDVQKLSM